MLRLEKDPRVIDLVRIYHGGDSLLALEVPFMIKEDGKLAGPPYYVRLQRECFDFEKSILKRDELEEKRAIAFFYLGRPKHPADICVYLNQ